MPEITTTENLQAQIDDLKVQVKALSNAGTIPFNLEQAFKSRGFLKSETTFITGHATLTVSGAAHIPLQGVSVNAMALATYSDGSGSDIGAVMANNSALFPNTTQLILSGIGTKTVNYIVFIPTDVTV